jgi:hypothetical protein
MHDTLPQAQQLTGFRQDGGKSERVPAATLGVTSHFPDTQSTHRLLRSLGTMLSLVD